MNIDYVNLFRDCAFFPETKTRPWNLGHAKVSESVKMSQNESTWVKMCQNVPCPLSPVPCPLILTYLVDFKQNTQFAAWDPMGIRQESGSVLRSRAPDPIGRSNGQIQ